MLPCGIITIIQELFLTESKAQVYGHLYDFFQSAPETASCLSEHTMFPFLAVLQIWKHVSSRVRLLCRCDLTPTTKILSSVPIVVDKMHMAGHVDPWCKKTCDSHLYTDLNKVHLIVLFDQ